MANRKNGTLYIGQTDDVLRRVSEHKAGEQYGFTQQYGCSRLVWFESHDTRASAFARERRLKDWNRAWKVELIEALNPDWDDLSLSMSEAALYNPERMFKAYDLSDVV